MVIILTVQDCLYRIAMQLDPWRRFSVASADHCSPSWIVALGCLLLCTAGCQRGQSQRSTSELTEEIKALSSRLEKLEGSRQPNSNEVDSANTQVDSAKAGRHFADVTHVVAAGRNVLIYFASRNYASGEPSLATTQLGVYMNYYTAKRLQAALAISMQRHASLFGDSPADNATVQPGAPDSTLYVNFVRLTGSPEELVIDLGLNRKPVGVSTEPIPISHTVIMDYHTTGAFYRQVSALVAEYEAKNGTIETDIQKRITN